jgi:hypothetical protein
VVICESENCTREELSWEYGYEERSHEAAAFASELASYVVARKDQEGAHERRPVCPDYIYGVHAGVSQSQDQGYDRYSPVHEWPEVYARSKRKVGQGIVESAVQVDHSALCEHHVIPGVALAAEAHIASYEHRLCWNDSSQVEGDQGCEGQAYIPVYVRYGLALLSDCLGLLSLDFWVRHLAGSLLFNFFRFHRSLSHRGCENQF